MTKGLLIGLAGTLLAANVASGQSWLCEDQFKLEDTDMACYRYGPEQPPPPPLIVPEAAPKPDPLHERILRYAQLALKHRLTGLASYYSRSLDGTLTANGERYRYKKYSAAHLTLPLGCWVEIRARATGRKIRLRVNDRGPYVNKFVIDLSESAARYLGVNRTVDRHVEIRIIAMPGEDPLPDPADTDILVAEEGAPLAPAAAKPAATGTPVAAAAQQ